MHHTTTPRPCLQGMTADTLGDWIRKPKDRDAPLPDFDRLPIRWRFHFALREPAGERSAIADRPLEWALDIAEGTIAPDAPATDLAAAIADTLDAIDCAGASAPSGLIYNADLAREAAAHWYEIDTALDEYREETGQDFAPRHGLTVGVLVWFAYDWMAHRLSGHVRWLCDLDG